MFRAVNALVLSAENIDLAIRHTLRAMRFTAQWSLPPISPAIFTAAARSAATRCKLKRIRGIRRLVHVSDTMKSHALSSESSAPKAPQGFAERVRSFCRNSLFVRWCMFSFTVVLVECALAPSSGYVDSMAPLGFALAALFLYETYAILSLLAKRAGDWSRLRMDTFVVVPLWLIVTIAVMAFLTFATYCQFNRCSFS